MRKTNAEAIVDYLEDKGITAEVYQDYSGRGMYGTTTTAVVTKDPFDVARAMGALDIDDSDRRDNMGMDMIVY